MVTNGIEPIMKPQPTPEEIAVIQHTEDVALGEYVEVARAQLLTIVNRNDRDIAAWQDSIKQLQDKIGVATIDRDKAQKALNAIDRIGPAVLPQPSKVEVV